MRIKSPVSFDELAVVVTLSAIVLGGMYLVDRTGKELADAHNPYPIHYGSLEAHADTLKAMESSIQ